MSTRHRLRAVVTVGIALVLVGITAGYGVWLLRISAAGHLMDQTMMGLVFMGPVVLLGWLLFVERPGKPERGQCHVCGATTETDWTVCAYCGAPLASG